MSALTVDDIKQKSTELRQAAQTFLRPRPARDIARRIGTLATRWLEPEYEPRRVAIDEMHHATGLSTNMIALGLDAAFWELVPPKLERLADEELGSSSVLDGWSPHPKTGRLVRASGPGLVSHILAGFIVTPGLWSLCQTLMLKSASLVKTSKHEQVFMKRFVESLRQEFPELGECVSVDYWAREQTEITEAMLNASDSVVAFGDDETIESLRAATLYPRIFVGHGHRVSLAVVEASAFTEATASAIVRDTIFFDQQGCLSPHVIYLVGDTDECVAFGATIADAMTQAEVEFPRRDIEPGAAVAIQRARGSHELKRAMQSEVQLWSSEGSTAWTLLYDEEPRFEMSCLNRTLRLKRLRSIDQLPHALEEVVGHLQGVAVAPKERIADVGSLLSRSSVSRVCSPGELQRPPLSWKSDGQMQLLPFVRSNRDVLDQRSASYCSLAGTHTTTLNSGSVLLPLPHEPTRKNFRCAAP